MAKGMWKDGRVEGCALIFSCENFKIATHCRTPRQENVGSHQKKMPQVQGQRTSPPKMVGGTKLLLETNPIPARDPGRAQTKPCVHQDPETPQRLSQTCL